VTEKGYSHLTEQFTSSIPVYKSCQALYSLQYAFSGLWHDLLPFARLSRQKIVKL